MFSLDSCETLHKEDQMATNTPDHVTSNVSTFETTEVSVKNTQTTSKNSATSSMTSSSLQPITLPPAILKGNSPHCDVTVAVGDIEENDDVIIVSLRKDVVAFLLGVFVGLFIGFIMKQVFSFRSGQFS